MKVELLELDVFVWHMNDVFWTKLCSRYDSTKTYAFYSYRLQLFAQNIKNKRHSSKSCDNVRLRETQMATSIEDLYDTQCKLIELDMCPWVGGPWWLLYVRKKRQKITELPVWLYINLGRPKWWIATNKNSWNMFWFHKKNRSQNLWSQTGPMHFLRCLMWQYRLILTISLQMVAQQKNTPMIIAHVSMCIYIYMRGGGRAPVQFP